MLFYIGNVLGIKDNLKQWEPNDVQEIKCVIEKGFSSECLNLLIISKLLSSAF
jgi:hypothetical protein